MHLSTTNVRIQQPIKFHEQGSRGSGVEVRKTKRNRGVKRGELMGGKDDEKDEARLLQPL